MITVRVLVPIILLPGVLRSQGPPMTCEAQAASTPSIRAEGISELVGDIVVVCTGGTPIASDRPLPQINIQIFSQPSINITSRVLTSGGNLIEFTEGLLFIDEPSPENQRPCGSPGYPHSITPATIQTVISGVCGAHAGSPDSNGVGTYDPNVEAPAFADSNGQTYPTYRGNAYQARRAGNNSLLWQGVPIDPPGALGSRVLRITNVRVNASQLGVPAGPPYSAVPVGMLVSTSQSGVFAGPLGGGRPGLPISNPTPIVAVAQPSFDFRHSGPRECFQCDSANEHLLDDGPSSSPNWRCDGATVTLRFSERFPTAFRRQASSVPGESQDVLGSISQTESGFHKAAATANWPARLQNGTPAAGTERGTLGIADSGTRLVARFTNVPDGVEIHVPVNALLRPLSSESKSGVAELVEGGSRVSISGGSGQAVWEITETDTTASERVEIPVTAVYRAGQAALGTALAAGGLAPISTVLTAGSAGVPIPRFPGLLAGEPMLTILPCRTNLLFPFVSNRSGFDTGIAIVNTSKDPFGTPKRGGACVVYFHGELGGEPVSLRHPSPSLAGGEHFVWSVSSGGAVAATPGFQGYLIAQCQFQFAHGFAWVTETGAHRLAMGYLGLVLDEGIPARTGAASESLGR